MNAQSDPGGDKPISAPHALAMRQAIVETGQALDDARALETCADQLLDAGLTAAAHAMYLLVCLRSGLSTEGLARMADIATRTGVGIVPPVVGRVEDRSPPVAAAVNDLQVLFRIQADLRPLNLSAAEAIGWISPPPAAGLPPEEPPVLLELLQTLLVSLAQGLAPDDNAGLSAALSTLRDEALAGPAFDLSDPRTPLDLAALQLAFNAARRWLLEVYDLAFAPFGSAALIHHAARLSDAGLGPYASRTGLLFRDGRDLLGLLQLAQDRPLDFSDGETARWAYLLARATSSRLRIDIVDSLADHGLTLALWALAAPALRDPDAAVDREQLQHIRDAGMDLDSLELAWRTQARIVKAWPAEPNEWLALADLEAYRGEYERAAAAFSHALLLAPHNEHGRNCLQALESGDRGRFVNHGGFGTPDDRKVLRGRAKRGESPVDEVEPARALALSDEDPALAPELLPGSPIRLGAQPDGLHLRRLGARRERSLWGELPTLRGVEAIRGFYLGRAPVVEVEVLLGGRLLARSVPAAHALETASELRRQSVFNIWVDLSSTPAGRYEVEIRLTDLDRHTHVHRETVQVAPARTEAELPGSDMVVDPPEAGADLEAAIDSRPSQVRLARRALLADPPREVLVLRVDQLGDMVCSIPALQRLRDMLPQARLTGLVSTYNAALARTLGVFDEVLVTDFRIDPAQGRRTMPLERQRELKAQLHARRFDLAIDLADHSPSRYLLLLSGARKLYGMQGYGFLDFDYQTRTRDAANASEELPASAKLLAMIEWLGVALRSHGCTLRRPDLNASRLERYGLQPAGYAVLHTGAQLRFSRWPHFPVLAGLLLARTELSVVLVSDDSTSTMRVPPGLLANPRFKLIEHTPSFDDLDTLVSYCALFVGNDSGPKHLASLRGAEVVSLHCARNNWSEWGQENRGVILSRRVPCAGCQISQHPEECGRDIACLRLISPEEVLVAGLGLIDTA